MKTPLKHKRIAPELLTKPKPPKIEKVQEVEWKKPEWKWYEKLGRKFKRGNEKAWQGVRGVYKYAITKLILAIVSFFVNPKLSFFFMISWLKQRLAEPSTVRGIIGMVATLGITISPELIKEITTLAVAILSFVEFVRKEKEKVEE
jgi:hypothetical protein